MKWSVDPFQQTTPPIFGKWRGLRRVNINKLKNKKMEIVLKTREELGLQEATGASETGIAKDLFKGLSYILNNRKDKRPSVTFINDKDKTSITVSVEEALVEPVRTGKIKIEHLMGFTVIRANNDGLYFLAPKVRATGSVDDVKVIAIEAIAYEELIGY